MPGRSRCACVAPAFNPANLAGRKNTEGGIARSAPQMRPSHISISKYKRSGRLRFNLRGSQPPPESLNRSESAGLKSAACGSPPCRAYRPYRRCGRVAEGGGLLNRYRVVKPYRGFESLRLRHPTLECASLSDNDRDALGMLARRTMPLQPTNESRSGHPCGTTPSIATAVSRDHETEMFLHRREVVVVV